MSQREHQPEIKSRILAQLQGRRMFICDLASALRLPSPCVRGYLIHLQNEGLVRRQSMVYNQKKRDYQHCWELTPQIAPPAASKAPVAAKAPRLPHGVDAEDLEWMTYWRQARAKRLARLQERPSV